MFERYQNGSKWVIHEGHYHKPIKADTGAFDTETLTLLNGIVATEDALHEHVENAQSDYELKKPLECNVWSWQIYDEFNGFVMANDFDLFIDYLARVGYSNVWCYNAKFDFSQIDYKILVEQSDKWQQHEKGKKTKGQAWTYDMLANGFGARYAYKLWIPRKNESRHIHVHAIGFYDLMNFYPRGLASLLNDLDIKDNDGAPIRKLEMDYQNVNIENPNDNDVLYCMNDVKGLYFAIKAWDNSICELSGGECHIYGKKVNVMTAGGFAKKELLRNLYPGIDQYERLKCYQREHVLSVAEDTRARALKLYRGGLCILNPKYRNKLIKGKLYRYDVNSEYPFAMSQIDDIIGAGREISFEEWSKLDPSKYHNILIVNDMYGTLKNGYVASWLDYDNNVYSDMIIEPNERMFFDFELQELSKWYDLSYQIKSVIIFERGEKIYAPFVQKYYELKRQYKKVGKKGLELATKLILNSCYGKLAERLERLKGAYEKSEMTGCVHYVQAGWEIDEKSRMSVYVGALVTAYARTYLMRNIRETYGAQMAQKFVYCDTDSIHGLLPMESDPYTLGGFKLEAECTAFKYLAPKTYVDITATDFRKKINNDDIELHTKGVNVKAVRNDVLGIKLKTLDERFTIGKRYWTLGAFNVRGGKILLPVHKYLVVPDTYDALVLQQGVLFEA